MVVLVRNDFTLVSLSLSLGLEKFAGGKYGDQKKLHLFSLLTYVENCYLLDILDGCLGKNWFLVFASKLGVWKFCWKEIWTMKRSCICFLCSVMFWITLQWTDSIVVMVRNVFPAMSLQPGLGFENFVEGKYWRSKEAVSVFFVKLHLELLSDEHIWGLCWEETISLKCLWVSSLLLKILLEGNMGNKEAGFCFLCQLTLRITI